MKRTKYTPGPWKVDSSRLSVSALGLVIAEVTQANAVANARLIAAAPDLLEACKAVMRAMADGAWTDTLTGQKVAAAIAKAED